MEANTKGTRAATAGGPAGHIEGTCGRNAPDKDEKDREQNPKVNSPSRAKRLVASTCGAVRRLSLNATGPEARAASCEQPSC